MGVLQIPNKLQPDEHLKPQYERKREREEREREHIFVGVQL